MNRTLAQFVRGIGIAALCLVLIVGCACSADKGHPVTGNDSGQTYDATGTNISEVNAANIKDALDRSSLDNVEVTVDAARKIVTLTGAVANAAAKDLAAQLAQQHAGQFLVQNEISINAESAETHGVWTTHRSQ